MKAVFPVWYRILAAAMIVGYVIFAGHVTYLSWDVLTGADVSELAPWRMAFWAIAIAAAGAGLIEALVFAHAVGVMQPLLRKSLFESQPPPPPRP